MNKLTTAKRVAVISALVEGCSIRSTVRMTGVSKNTVTKLLVDIGKVCSKFQDNTLVNLPCKRLQLDEIWSFVGAKQKNVPESERGQGRGDVWTWTAISDETKLVPSWYVGLRDAESAMTFVGDLAGRLANRVQSTTDGHRPYLDAVEDAFGCDIDYAMLVKMYGSSREDERRYNPATCVGSEQHAITGRPERKHISTSYVERQNLTMRMNMRWFTRLTTAFSKKVENHVHAISLHFMHYNFVRIHQTLKSTPAMRAGVADHKWSIEEIVGLLVKAESSSN